MKAPDSYHITFGDRYSIIYGFANIFSPNLSPSVAGVQDCFIATGGKSKLYKLGIFFIICAKPFANAILAAVPKKNIITNYL